MSVVVKGMKMPLGCWVCPCCNRSNGYCQADYTSRRIESHRPDWCPLEEVDDEKNNH